MLSVVTSPSSGDRVFPSCDLLVSHEMGVRRAPPRDSSDPRPFCSEPVGLPHETEVGSTPPFERTLALEGSGMAGGRGNTCAPDDT